MKADDSGAAYVPDYRLKNVYREANLLDEAGLSALCPSFSELSNPAPRYRDESPIGRGAVKEVSRIYDTHAKRWVAMAQVREDQGSEMFDPFVHEAWLTSSLNHPNIIKIYDVGVGDDERPFFTMDLKGGTTLADVVLRESVVGAKDAPSYPDIPYFLNIFGKICDAIAYAHARGVLHLDLKPANVQVDCFGEVLVCDWGLSKCIDGEALESHTHIARSHAVDRETEAAIYDNMTLIGEVKGTPGFMAPEQVLPGGKKDRRTDVFSLGCLLYFILTRTSPFDGESRGDMLSQTAHASIESPRTRFPHLSIPPGIAAVVMKAVARNPTERYPSVAMLKEDLVRYGTGFATGAQGASFFRDSLLFVKRNMIPVVITLAAVVLLTIFSVLSIQRINREEQVADEQRKRATAFKSQADQIASLYQDEMAQTEQSRIDLSQKLAKSANSLKNLGIFSNPARSVREARQLVEMAIALDPQCEKARIERFSLNCLTLNFVGAIAHPPPDHHRFADYIEFAKAFPNYQFSEKVRPSDRELATFFRRARDINPNRAPLMERILSYDSAVRRIPISYVEPTISVVEYLNGGTDYISTEYVGEDSSLTIQSDHPIRLVIPEGSGSGRCILHYLRLRNLILQSSTKFSLSELHYLPVKTLDLRGCSNLDLSKPVALPLLRKVMIRPGQVSPGNLRRRIQSVERFEVITSDEK